MRIRWSLVLVLVFVGSMLAACGTPAPAATEAPAAEPTGAPTAEAATPEVVGPAPASILVGGIVQLTGPFAGGGAQVKSGFELAIADINAKGGVMVRQYGARIPLEMKVIDDGTNADNAAAAFETLGSEGQVVAVLGSYSSSAMAAAPVADKFQIPYLAVAFAQNSAHQQGYKYLFSPFPKSPAIAKATFDMLDALPADQKPSTVAIMAEKTDWATELTGLWTQEAGSRGYKVVDTEQYDPGSTDYVDNVQKLNAANADVLLALPTTPDGIAIYKEMAKQGYAPKFTMFIRAPDVPTWPQDPGPIGDYVAFMPGWSNAMKYPGVDQLNAAYQAQTGRPADPLVGPAYACVQLLADAIERAGSLDHEAIRKAFLTTDLETVVGPVTFNADGTGNVSVPFLQYQKGKTQLVWPKEFATADLIYPAPPYDQR